ncbi:hypothetical protein FRUB_06416 [Fimbriiglobus ruber]|uniref:Uncharacterized protein n=1 Tax=Fimbriiglobus ruber TaxID=1908690 RepID=A0A225DIK9_9BACT|nr:hypothetical protein FRUB_06416 [Fimbriiglobus ruber]
MLKIALPAMVSVIFLGASLYADEDVIEKKLVDAKTVY